MLNEIYENTKEQMQKSIASLKHDFSGLRTGKVSTKIVEGISIDYYGAQTPLNGVASVSTPDANTITISPWEKNLLGDIEKVLQQANIGVNPNNNGEIIMLNFPPMTSEQRKETAKQAKAMSEKAKVSARNARKESNNKVKKLEKANDITEDESKKAQDEIQKITDNCIAGIEDALKTKEAAILKI
jgi:ribosome recycling factor